MESEASSSILKRPRRYPVRYGSNDQLLCLISGVITGLGFDAHTPYQYGVFLLKVQSLSQKDCITSPLVPVLTMDESFYKGMTFALIGSILYMIGGSDEKLNRNRKPRQVKVWSKKVISFNLLPIIRASKVETRELKRSELTKVQDMHTPKIEPLAVIITGKICVFSQLIRAINGSDLIHFEIFDPSNGVWIKLPNLPGRCPDFRIEAHSIVSSRLFISTDRDQVYFIDLDVPTGADYVWRCLNVGDTEYYCIGRKGQYLVLDDLCFSPLSVSIVGQRVLLPLNFSPPKERGDDDRDVDYIGMTEMKLTRSSDQRTQTQMWPVAGGCRLVHLGGNRLCTVKVGFENVRERPCSPSIILESFNFNSLASTPTLQKSGRSMEFNYSGCFSCAIHNEHAKLVEITAFRSSLYKVSDCPCSATGVEGFFLVVLE